MRDQYSNFVLVERSNTTNPLIKFLSVLLITLFLFIVKDIFKIYLIVVTLILYHKFIKFPYDVAKPKYRALILFSITIFLVQIFFVKKGEFLFYLIPRIEDFGPFIPIYETGIYQGFFLIGRLWSIIILSLIFVNSTNPFEFAQSLTKIRIPYRLAYTFSLSLRFIPVLENETKLVQNAQQARGLNISPSNIRGIINLLRFTLIPLISSTLNRIKDITISMDGRGFGYYTTRSYMKDIAFRRQDWVKFFLIIIILIVITFL